MTDKNNKPMQLEFTNTEYNFATISFHNYKELIVTCLIPLQPKHSAKHPNKLKLG